MLLTKIDLKQRKQNMSTKTEATTCDPNNANICYIDYVCTTLKRNNRYE